MQGGRKENGESNANPGVLSVSTHYRLLLTLVKTSSRFQMPIPNSHGRECFRFGSWELEVGS